MKKEDKVLETRKKIIDAAIVEFGTKGYRSASTNEICEACEISKGIIFYHFKSKASLFKACAEICIREFDEYMQENYLPEETPLVGIRRCCLLRKNYFSSHPSYHRIFCEVLYREENAAEITKDDTLKKMYENHSYDVLDKILMGTALNSRNSREENIWIAVKLIEFIDMQTYQSGLETEDMLEEQMKQYEAFLGALLYGILDK